MGKIAAVSDSAVFSVAPRLAKHFVKAEVRHFSANDRPAALVVFRSGSVSGSAEGIDRRLRVVCQT